MRGGSLSTTVTHNYMHWKHKKRLLSDDDDNNKVAGQFPIYINNGPDQPQQMSVGIRVVENAVFFYGDIDDETSLELNRVLMEVDNKLQHSKTILGEDAFTPIIHLHICTCGGNLYPAFSTVDTIRNLRSKTYTYVEGLVASAGTLLSSVGDRRFIGKYSHMLIHQLSSESYGTFAEMENDLQNCSKLMKILKDFYKQYTKIPMKKLDELMKKDIYMDAGECLAYGVVDEIR